jgi:CHAD domain-containing protein
MEQRRVPSLHYRFLSRDASVEAGLRRIALEQVDCALGAVDAALRHPRGKAAETAVHEARKSGKKLRALLRLVRPVFDSPAGGYSAENARLRDAAAALSPLRDGDVLLETYDALLGAFADEVKPKTFAGARRCLVRNRKQAAEARDLPADLRRLRAELKAAQERVHDWRLSADGWAALEGGLGALWKDARQAMREARADPADEPMHEWRKAVKYHWYHARLLAPIWPDGIAAHCAAADRLGDLLGKHHDLAVLRATLDRDPKRFGKARAVELLRNLARRRQETLAAEAFLLGARLLTESRKGLLRRWGAWWDLWERQGKAPKQLAA